MESRAFGVEVQGSILAGLRRTYPKVRSMPNWRVCATHINAKQFTDTQVQGSSLMQCTGHIPEGEFDGELQGGLVEVLERSEKLMDPCRARFYRVVRGQEPREDAVQKSNRRDYP